MKILLVAATPFELAPCLNWLEVNFTRSEDRFVSGTWEVIPLICGVGLVATTYNLSKKLHTESVDLAIQAGIAGCFHKDWELGGVYQIISERFGDLGAETAERGFLDLTDLQLQDPDQFPFSNGKIKQEESPLSFLPTAHAVSVHKVHGATFSVQQIQKKYHPDLESMEGAAFFYVCRMEKVRFLQVRSISNYVEARNRENWNIPLAIDKLNEVLISFLESLNPD